MESLELDGRKTTLVDLILEDMYENKIMVRSLGKVIYIMLPLISSKDIVVEVVENLIKAVRTLALPEQARRPRSMARPAG